MIKEYTHSIYNVVTLYPNWPLEQWENDNHHLFTAALMRVSEGTTVEKEIANYLNHDPDMYRFSYKTFLEMSAREPGLYNRWPGRNDGLVSHDEYHGIMYYASKYYKSIAEDIMEYAYTKGRKYTLNGSFNNVDPGKWTGRSWQFRLPTTKAFYEACAGRKPGLFSQLYYALGILTSATTNYGETSGKQLAWLTVGVMKKRPEWIIRGSIWLWRKMMRKKYPDGAREMLKIFYRDQNHPINKLAPNHWDN